MELSYGDWVRVWFPGHHSVIMYKMKSYMNDFAKYCEWEHRKLWSILTEKIWKDEPVGFIQWTMTLASYFNVVLGR